MPGYVPAPITEAAPAIRYCGRRTTHTRDPGKAGSIPALTRNRRPPPEAASRNTW
jgi:hypothetical protein